MGVHQTQLTDRALGYRAVQLLAYVRQTIEREGIAPSYEMICDELGLSSRAKVTRIVESLERRRLLSRVGTGKCPRGKLSRNVRRITLGLRAE